MRELLDHLDEWYREGRTFALATVVSTLRSAPRDAGAVMAVSADGTALGSVSGGCVEGAVYELAQEVVADGLPRTAAYGISDDDALMVGLTCGGTLEVYVEPVDSARYPEFPEVVAALRDGLPIAVATVVSTDDPTRLGARTLVGAGDGAGQAFDPSGDDECGPFVGVVRDLLAADETALLRQDVDGPTRIPAVGVEPGEIVFVRSFVPRPRLLVFGSNDYAAAVARVGAFAGYRVTVCDARPVFATEARFPDVDELVVDWPDRYLAGTRVDARTAVCVLTHDPKFDVPVLVRALRLPVAYVGAMGSRRAHDDRLRRLREAGVTEDELARLHSPIGLDLGSRTPQETAIAVLAEIIHTRHGGTARPLSLTSGRIHR
ncbi:XdhC/CoxI family protein [Streptomyces sp. SID3343]|uniref:XdhC family protein n=1 Tax=Streptomyces sp. SID3343 TaxID=2690260 RepID=UPI00136A0085|nr:XdhC/CoxI family protein [Streptomyces sp. SID3343]MYW00823.1 XshC-Cox1 family protein [Streptomyces sp. SID3343]